VATGENFTLSEKRFVDSLLPPLLENDHTYALPRKGLAMSSLIFKSFTRVLSKHQADVEAVIIDVAYTDVANVSRFATISDLLRGWIVHA
jgi:hypothetical protein